MHEKAEDDILDDTWIHARAIPSMARRETFNCESNTKLNLRDTLSISAALSTLAAHRKSKSPPKKENSGNSISAITFRPASEPKHLQPVFSDMESFDIRLIYSIIGKARINSQQQVRWDSEPSPIFSFECMCTIYSYRHSFAFIIQGSQFFVSLCFRIHSKKKACKLETDLRAGKRTLCKGSIEMEKLLFVSFHTKPHIGISIYSLLDSHSNPEKRNISTKKSGGPPRRVPFRTGLSSATYNKEGFKKR